VCVARGKCYRRGCRPAAGPSEGRRAQPLAELVAWRPIRLLGKNCLATARHEADQTWRLPRERDPTPAAPRDRRGPGAWERASVPSHSRPASGKGRVQRAARALRSSAPWSAPSRRHTVGTCRLGHSQAGPNGNLYAVPTHPPRSREWTWPGRSEAGPARWRSGGNGEGRRAGSPPWAPAAAPPACALARHRS
jgi:hypothetical protein